MLKNPGAADKVEGLELADGRRLHARVVVNAAGPHSSSITALAFHGAGVPNDMTVTTRPLRQEVRCPAQP